MWVPGRNIFCFDAAPSKQNMFLPGSHIPIKGPELLETIQPEAIVVLPWNLANEVHSLLDNSLKKAFEMWVVFPRLSLRARS